MKRIRYTKFHLVLDLFGLSGFGLTVYFYYQGHSVRQSNEELYNLWLSFSTGIVMLWIGVRIIEHLIRRFEKESSARIRTVRNMRFLVRSIRNEIEYPRRGDLDQLKHELGWTQMMFNKHRRVFRQDEIGDVNSFYAVVQDALGKIKELLEVKRDYTASAKSKEEFERKQEELWLFMARLEEARSKAEENILRETDEEWV